MQTCELAYQVVGRLVTTGATGRDKIQGSDVAETKQYTTDAHRVRCDVQCNRQIHNFFNRNVHSSQY